MSNTGRRRTTVSLHPEIMDFILKESRRLHTSVSQTIERYLLVGIEAGRIQDPVERGLDIVRNLNRDGCSD
jgi:hypothetical protein